MNCKDAHQFCKALCCKLISFAVPALSDEQINYFNMHEGVSVVKRQECYLVLVRTKCKNLTEDLSCAVYGKPERPQICNDGYNEHKTGLVFVPGCIYPPNKRSIVLTGEELP